MQIMNVGKSMVTVLLVFIVLFMATYVVAVTPSGATVTPGTSSSAPEDAPGNDTNALAGNVTNLNFFGYSNTQAWQGYFGNVTGTIQLADSSDNVLYNWSLASPQGEVYSSQNSSINWTGIACYNMSLHTQLETRYNIASDDVDGVNETFAFNNHPLYYTNNVQFSAGACNNTVLYNQSGQGAFYQTLMTDDVTNGENVIFASILREEDAQGFDGTFYDFEMIVLEDGHGTDTATSTYYFWVELE